MDLIMSQRIIDRTMLQSGPKSEPPTGSKNLVQSRPSTFMIIAKVISGQYPH